MRNRIGILFLLLAAATFSVLATSDLQASAYRQYYSNWSYHPTHSYYYTRYYYRPTPTYQTYSYHYCVHYPSQPRYVYYYNPYARQYWGRYDCEGQPGQQYSLLKPQDRREKLEDIPEKAFPKPSAMPEIPEAADGTKSDGVAIEPVKALPSPDAEPGDLPAGTPKP